MRRTFFADHAWLGGGDVRRDVRIDVDGDRIVAVAPDAEPSPDATSLTGLTFPGFVNAHSHVFHRAVRGHGHAGVGSFWQWRELMYAVADRLDPDTLYDLALATYAEMALAGITCVGEFFYVHHDRDGTAYADPNEMGHTVARAAADAGLRITLLDTCYLQGGVDGRPLTGVQRRFGDGDWERWAERVERLEDTATTRVGAAIHSVRGVPRAALAPVADVARTRGLPLHAHVSEQPAENDDCLSLFGLTPTQLLVAEGVLGTDFTSVHATHLTDADIAAYGDSGSSICMCCTTERDLADGIGPAGRLHDAGANLCLGSDSHAIIDPLEEARAIELDLRLASGIRGHLSVPALAGALTAGGADSLGWNAGRIEPGALADLTVVDLSTPRTGGARSGDPLAHVVFAAQAGDVRTVIRGGETVVDDFRHLRLTDTGRLLDQAIAAVLE